MKKRVFAIIFCLIAILSICSAPQTAFADTESDLDDAVQRGLDNLDFSQVEQIGFDFVGDIVQKIQSLINGNYDSAESFWKQVAQLFCSSVVGLLPQLITVFVVLVILGLIRKTNNGIITGSTNGVIGIVGVAVVVSAIISLLVQVYKDVYCMLDTVCALSQASTPILLTLLVANGGNAVSAVCQPSMVMFSSVIIQLVTSVVLPISIFGLAFGIVSNLSDNVKVGKMSAFLNSLSSWILGVVFTVFGAFTAVEGISASTVDGVSYRMAKFAVKNYVPILGGYVADGFDVVVAGTTLIKNAFGLVVLLILFGVVVRPLVSCICVNLGLQALGGITEPIVDEKYVKLLGGISKFVTFLSVLVIAVAFMFCIVVLVAICCVNGV